MRFQIDQSGKVEQTQWDTVVADSTGFAIRINAKEKRRFLHNLRRTHTSELYPLIYAVLLVQIMRHHPNEQVFESDIEYTGKEAYITRCVETILGSKGVLRFRLIGKRSLAHSYAISIYRAKKKVTTISASEVLRIIKKSGL